MVSVYIEYCRYRPEAGRKEGERKEGEREGRREVRGTDGEQLK